ncbi:RraA-like protein [Pestalotiopsis sp. NC0098]|nr:RraA-like protein [Pestalotiopsis sp. NC0098]
MAAAHSSDLDPIVEALKEFTTCDISDALIKLKYRNGGFLPGLTLWSPQRQDGDTKIVGPAYTVKYALLSDPVPKAAGHYIDTVPRGAVVFVSSPPIPNAVYGGLMSTRARALGAAGTVIDGRFRDVAEHRALDYPVFARDTGTAPPAELVKVVGVDVPVDVQQGGVQQVVRPGDYLVGDVNGVVVLPREMAADALELMRKGVAADEKMAEAIKNGMGFVEASKKFRG